MPPGLEDGHGAGGDAGLRPEHDRRGGPGNGPAPHHALVRKGCGGAGPGAWGERQLRADLPHSGAGEDRRSLRRIRRWIQPELFQPGAGDSGRPGGAPVRQGLHGLYHGQHYRHGECAGRG